MLTTRALLIAPAAAESLGRELDGRVVIIEQAPDKTALVFWSMDCTECTQQLRALERAGVRVVGINTDAASSAGRLRAFVHTSGFDSPMIADPSGDLQEQFQLQEGVVVLDEQGGFEARISDFASVEDAFQAAGCIHPSTIASQH